MSEASLQRDVIFNLFGIIWSNQLFHIDIHI